MSNNKQSMFQYTNLNLKFRKNYYLSDNPLSLKGAIRRKFKEFLEDNESGKNGENHHFKQLLSRAEYFWTVTNPNNIYQPGNLIDTGKVRLDKQGADKRMINLQLQLNGVTRSDGNTTVATIIMTTSFWEKFRNDPKRLEIVKDFIDEFKRICALHLIANQERAHYNDEIRQLIQKLSRDNLYDQLEYDLLGY